MILDDDESNDRCCRSRSSPRRPSRAWWPPPTEDAPSQALLQAVEEPSTEELEAALRRHDRDRRPGPDVPQGDRQGRAADRRGGGRPGQGDRARRADRRGAVEGGRLAPRVDAPRHGAQDPDGQTAAPAAVRRRDPSDGRDAIADPARPTCTPSTPTSTSSGPAGTSSPTAPRTCSRRREPALGLSAAPSAETSGAARLVLPVRAQRRPRLTRQPGSCARCRAASTRGARRPPSTAPRRSARRARSPWPGRPPPRRSAARPCRSP